MHPYILPPAFTFNRQSLKLPDDLFIYDASISQQAKTKRG